MWPVLPTLPKPHMFNHLYTTIPTLPNLSLLILTVPYLTLPYPILGISLALFPLAAVGHLCGIPLEASNEFKIRNQI